MKNKLKSIIGNGLPWGLTFFGLSLILSCTFRVGLQDSLKVSALMGFAALLVNGLTYSRFTKPLKALEDISIKLDNTESLVMQMPANHLVQDSLVSGKLFLTDQRMLFKAYGSEESLPQVYAWDLPHLEPVDFSGSLWNAGGEFLLKTKDDMSLLFEVNELRPWRNALQLHFTS